jgi:extradiol dioxygenase family protein
MAGPCQAASRGQDIFTIEPHLRFAGEIGEQATMFFLDPSGNAVEFKAFRDPSQLFAKATEVR